MRHASLTTSPLFLLRLFDQLLADHHVRRGTMKIIVEAQASEITKIADVSGSVRGGMAAEIGAELRDQRADAQLQEAHRAGGGAGGLGADADGAGRRVRHHEGVGDHHDHLGAEQPGRRLVEPGDAPEQIQQAAAELQRQPEPDQFLQRMARREAHAEEIADQIGKAGGRKPRAIFGAGAAHLRHHDVGPAAGEGEDDLRGQHLAQHIADEGAARDQAADVAAKAAGFGAVAARLRQREARSLTVIASDAAVIR